jgi:Ca2+-transporting ATPase
VKNLYSKFGFFENKYLVGAFIIGTLMQVIVVLIPPVAQIFKLVSLNKIQWLYTIGISLAPLVIIEIQKKFEEIKFGKVVYKNYISGTGQKI